MAVIEKSGLMKYKDKSGNLYLMLPITNMDNVDGLDEALAGKADSNHTHTAADVGADASGSADRAANEALLSAQTYADEVRTNAKSYTDTAIQSAIQNTWEASY